MEVTKRLLGNRATVPLVLVASLLGVGACSSVFNSGPSSSEGGVHIGTGDPFAVQHTDGDGENIPCSTVIPEFKTTLNTDELKALLGGKALITVDSLRPDMAGDASLSDTLRADNIQVYAVTSLEDTDTKFVNTDAIADALAHPATAKANAAKDDAVGAQTFSQAISRAIAAGHPNAVVNFAYISPDTVGYEPGSVAVVGFGSTDSCQN